MKKEKKEEEKTNIMEHHGKSRNIMEPHWGQRAKNPVSASALLTGKILRVRKIFARMVYNVSLKGQILSRQCISHPDNMDGFKLFI